MSEPKFVPNTVYVTYIASTPAKVWEALTRAEFTRQYFFGHSIEVEAKVGGRSRAAEARALERKLADEKGALERARALLAFAG